MSTLTDALSAMEVTVVATYLFDRRSSRAASRITLLRMTYGFTQDVPIDADFYGRILDRLGNEPPRGLLRQVFGDELSPEPDVTPLTVLHVWQGVPAATRRENIPRSA